MEKNCSCFASFLSIYREHMYFDYNLFFFLPQLNNKASPIYKNVLNVGEYILVRSIGYLIHQKIK